MGVVEGVLPVAFNALRVKWEAAVLITLVYRAVTFWFALVVGGVTFRLLQRKPATQPVTIDKILCAAQRCEPKLL